VGEQVVAKGVSSQPIRQGSLADVIVSELQGRYAEMSRNQRIYIAHAISTTPIVYTNVIGGSQPILWNGSSDINVALLYVTYSLTATSTTTGSALGIIGGVGQISAPTSTTAIDFMRCLYIGGPQPRANAYQKGTVVNAPTFFMPIGSLHSGAITVDNANATFGIDVGGAFIAPPYSWLGFGVSVVPTTSSVATVTFVWAEVPI
jgi:hypothetical protein